MGTRLDNISVDRLKPAPVDDNTVHPDPTLRRKSNQALTWMQVGQGQCQLLGEVKRSRPKIGGQES